MSLYEVYSNPNLRYGALFVDPETTLAIEVSDLESKAGIKASLVVIGRIDVHEDWIVKGAEMVHGEGADEVLAAWNMFQAGSYPFERYSYPVRVRILNAYWWSLAWAGMYGVPERIILVYREAAPLPPGYDSVGDLANEMNATHWVTVRYIGRWIKNWIIGTYGEIRAASGTVLEGEGIFEGDPSPEER